MKLESHEKWSGGACLGAACGNIWFITKSMIIISISRFLLVSLFPPHRNNGFQRFDISARSRVQPLSGKNLFQYIMYTDISENKSVSYSILKHASFQLVCIILQVVAAGEFRNVHTLRSQ